MSFLRIGRGTLDYHLLPHTTTSYYHIIIIYFFLASVTCCHVGRAEDSRSAQTPTPTRPFCNSLQYPLVPR